MAVGGIVLEWHQETVAATSDAGYLTGAAHQDHQILHFIEQHRAIVDALCQHEPDAAKTSMRVHLCEMYATIERLGLCDMEENTPLLRR